MRSERCPLTILTAAGNDKVSTFRLRFECNLPTCNVASRGVDQNMQLVGMRADLWQLTHQDAQHFSLIQRSGSAIHLGDSYCSRRSPGRSVHKHADRM
jgi:hypothetical protein